MEGLRSKSVPLPAHRGGDKTKGDLQEQDSIKFQPRESQFHCLLLSCLAGGFGEYLPK